MSMKMAEDLGDLSELVSSSIRQHRSTVAWRLGRKWAYLPSGDNDQDRNNDHDRNIAKMLFDLRYAPNLALLHAKRSALDLEPFQQFLVSFTDSDIMLGSHYHQRYMTLLDALFRNVESRSIRPELRNARNSLKELGSPDPGASVYVADELRRLPRDAFESLINSAVSFYYVVRMEDHSVQSRVAKYLIHSSRLMPTLRSKEVARAFFWAVAREPSLRRRPSVRSALLTSGRIDAPTARIILKSCNEDERRRIKQSHDVPQLVKDIT